MSDTTQPETVEVNEQAIANFVIASALECREVEAYIPNSIENGDVWEEVATRNVESVKSTGDMVEVIGSFTVAEVVGRIPAGGGPPGEPPTNPPETLTRSRDGRFIFYFTFEDLGMIEGEIEVE